MCWIKKLTFANRSCSSAGVYLTVLLFLKLCNFTYFYYNCKAEQKDGGKIDLSLLTVPAVVLTHKLGWIIAIFWRFSFRINRAKITFSTVVKWQPTYWFIIEFIELFKSFLLILLFSSFAFCLFRINLRALTLL